jgi:hypothetical protein
MTDKDLLVVVSEMLRKQDQQSEKLDEHSEIMNKHTEILNQQTNLINETNNTLRQLMEVSIQQFQQQQQFNEKFLDKLGDIEKSLNK